MTLEQTRLKLRIAQYARLINYAADAIHDYEPNIAKVQLSDIASLAEELAEDARKLAADIELEGGKA